MRKGVIEDLIENAHNLRVDDRFKNKINAINMLPEFKEIFKDPHLELGHL